MNAQRIEVHKLEQECLRLIRLGQEEARKPPWAQNRDRLERLRDEFRVVHQKWTAAKMQTALDV